MPVVAQPLTCDLEIRTCLGDEPPESTRVVELPEMHQLVDEHVIAHAVWHQDEAPVQTDVSGWRARAPSRALIAYAHLGDRQAVLGGKAMQPRRKLARRSQPQLRDRIDGVGQPRATRRSQARPLPGNPMALLFGKLLGMAPRAPARECDPDTPIRSYTNHVTPGPRMPYEFHGRITIVPRHGS